MKVENIGSCDKRLSKRKLPPLQSCNGGKSFKKVYFDGLSWKNEGNNLSLYG